MTVPLVDLYAQYEPLEEEILGRIRDSLRGMRLFLGENVQDLEQEFASYCETRHAVGLGSGTDALHVALRAIGVGHGDEVITTSNTFVATAEAIRLAGARPVFVDVDPDTLNMDPALIEAAITDKTQAIIPVHLYGHPAPMRPIMEIARRRGLKVIEDACQAHGARYEGQRVGSLGDIACFSFYFTKNLGAYGEAGMLVTNDDAAAEAARRFRDHGSSAKYVHPSVGANARLDELQAAILRVKLPHLDAWNERRRALASAYAERLADVPLQLPVERPWANAVYHLFVVRTPHRDELQRWLSDGGVHTGIHYPIPIHLQEGYRSFSNGAGSLPVTEKAVSEILSLPMYPELTEAQLDEVVIRLSRFFGQKAEAAQRTATLA
ncbi:MAG: DegT/DnrJ/EryC1/StrS family aminotransferase [Chloroflexota bacterium]